jgi:hypothetical protein
MEEEDDEDIFDGDEDNGEWIGEGDWGDDYDSDAGDGEWWGEEYACDIDGD